MKHYFGLDLFVKAYRITRREIWVSVYLLAIVTFIFATLLYLAEHSVSADYSFCDALVWTFVKYVEDPADIASAPVTLVGKIIGTLVGVLGIAIFAVPAGLIGSGLMDAMANGRREETTEKNSVLLHKRFRRIAQSASWFINSKGIKVTYKFVPRFRSLAQIQVKTGMADNEVIDAVNNCPDMRLMNLASTQRNEDMPQDRLVVVNYPLNNEYGCCKDRQSDVTIVAPVAVTELGTGSFAYSLAAMGGFNYVSKELSPNPDDPFGFYSMQKSNLSLIGDYDTKEDVESQALHFMDDLKTLKNHSEAKGKRHWFVFIMGTTKSTECQAHFWRLATNTKKTLPISLIQGKEYGTTTLAEDEEVLQRIFSLSKEALEAREVVVDGKKQSISVCLDNCDILKSVGPSNIMCRMGGGIDCNALTLRLGYEILIYHSSHLLIAKDIADAIKSQVEPEHALSEEAKKSILSVGDGYADEFGKTEVFEQDPTKLKKMIAEKSKEARDKFEKLDLDGNVQETRKKVG
jgi:voltage-gated potassium channel